MSGADEPLLNFFSPSVRQAPEGMQCVEIAIRPANSKHPSDVRKLAFCSAPKDDETPEELRRRITEGLADHLHDTIMQEAP